MENGLSADKLEGLSRVSDLIQFCTGNEGGITLLSQAVSGSSFFWLLDRSHVGTLRYLAECKEGGIELTGVLLGRTLEGCLKLLSSSDLRRIADIVESKIKERGPLWQ